MKDVYEKLFGESQTTIFRKVSRIISASRYEVEDSTGRKTFVNSNSYYPVGVEVIIRDGVIIGPTKRRNSPKVYEV